MYRRQLRAGRWLLHEHPATAVSWNEQCINKLTEDLLVQVVKADQCQYGLTSPAPDGRPLPALKPTKCMTNASPVAKLLQRQCQKDHEHQQLVSGRCAAAAFYPDKLIRTIIKGIRSTKRATPGVVHAVVEGLGTMGTKNGRCNKVGGGHIDFQFELRNFKEVYRDEYTNELLPPHLIQAAITEELKYFNSRVWEISDVKEMKAFPNSKLVRCRWVLCNKRDA